VSQSRDLAAEQAAFWNGPGAKGWLAARDRIERGIAGYGADALAAAAARPGERVLDIGCGPGVSSRALAEAVGAEGQVLGLDIAAPLIEAARVAGGPPHLSYATADAATHGFSPASFDLLFSRFGVMFFADPVAAFANLRRALKPGGRLAFVCWRTLRENPWGLVPILAAAPHLPPLPRPGPEEPGQYSFGDRARVERILAASGFVDATLRPLDRPMTLGRDVETVLDELAKFGALARAFAEATPEQARAARAAITEALKPHAGPEGFVLASACWCVTARAG